jgi:hypothetical protein
MSMTVSNRKRGIRLPHTPLTDQTFKRQGWRRVVIDIESDIGSVADTDMVAGEVYYYMLPLPKSSVDEYTPQLISNATDEIDALLELGLNPGTFFVELYNTDGLGFCTTEEQLEVLYFSLTNESIE